MDDLRALLLRLAADGLPVELCYHPDADPGDGSGWSALIGDRYTHGTLDAVVARVAAHAGPSTPTETP